VPAAFVELVPGATGAVLGEAKVQRRMSGIAQVAHMLKLGIAANLRVGQLHGQGFDVGVRRALFGG